MGRLLFLSAIAFMAYKYIGRSNKNAQPQIGKSAQPEIGFKVGDTEVLPPVRAEASNQLTAPSLAAESDPRA